MAKFGAGTLLGLNLGWSVINNAVNLANFPKDSSDAKDVIMRQLIAAPHLLPIALAVICLLALIAAFWWPEKKAPPRDDEGGPGRYTQNHTGPGDNNMRF